jgi:hypothetical protein
MLGLWRWYINTTIKILDIIHRPVFCLKLNSTQLNSTQLYTFVRIPEETHYVSTTSPIG